MMDIMSLVKGFVPDGDQETLDKVEGMLFVKKILMGGDNKTINHKELGFLFSHLPKLLSLVLDAIRYKHLILEQPDAMTFLKDDVADLSDILFHPSRGDRRMEGLFHVDVRYLFVCNALRHLEAATAHRVWHEQCNDN